MIVPVEMSTPGKQAVEGRPDVDSVPARDVEIPRERSRSISPEGLRPPLPPRPTNLSFLDGRPSTSSESPQSTRPSARPSLLSKATTALSLTDINTQVSQDGSREQHASTKAGIGFTGSTKTNINHWTSARTSEAGDSSSIRSYLAGAETTQDVESLFGDTVGGWREESGIEAGDTEDKFTHADSATLEIENADVDFDREFEDLGEVNRDGSNEGDYFLFLVVPLKASKLDQNHSWIVGRQSISTSSYYLLRASRFTLGTATRVSSLVTSVSSKL